MALDQPLRGADVDARPVLEEPLRVVPYGHPAGSDQHDVPFLQADLLPVDSLLQVLWRDRIAVGQHGHALGGRHVQQHAAGDDRRPLVGAALGSDGACWFRQFSRLEANIVLENPELVKTALEAQLAERSSDAPAAPGSFATLITDPAWLAPVRVRLRHDQN